MHDLSEFRAGKPGFYPDQAIHAQYACARLGLTFRDIDGGSGLLFTVASAEKAVHFGAGRCSWYPQNNATAATLASDKYFTSKILEAAGVPTLGGDYFFLHARHRGFRSDGHERDDAMACFKRLGATAFVKPLAGSRGDFAQAIADEAALRGYLDDVSRYYDSVLMQPVVTADAEYRVFILDDDVVYVARKTRPNLTGDGIHSIRDLLAMHDAALQQSGLSPASVTDRPDPFLDRILADNESWAIPGRMNLSAGGSMTLEAEPDTAVVDHARRAAHALGLRAAGVDLFAGIGGDRSDIRVIEVNANPSIRLLEKQNRSDLILRIWRHAFSAMGLLSV